MCASGRFPTRDSRFPSHSPFLNLESRTRNPHSVVAGDRVSYRAERSCTRSVWAGASPPATFENVDLEFRIRAAAEKPPLGSRRRARWGPAVGLSFKGAQRRSGKSSSAPRMGATGRQPLEHFPDSLSVFAGYRRRAFLVLHHLFHLVELVGHIDLLGRCRIGRHTHVRHRPRRPEGSAGMRTSRPPPRFVSSASLPGIWTHLAHHHLGSTECPYA